jgi:hypothetical protein
MNNKVLIIFFVDGKSKNWIIKDVLDISIEPYSRTGDYILMDKSYNNMTVVTEDVTYNFHTGIEKLIYVNEKDLIYAGRDCIGYKKTVFFYEEENNE